MVESASRSVRGRFLLGQHHTNGITAELLEARLREGTYMNSLRCALPNKFSFVDVLAHFRFLALDFFTVSTFMSPK